MTLQNTHGILMPYPSVFSSLLHSRFHIQFCHRPVTPIPLRPPATVGSLDSPFLCVCVCVCTLIDHGCVSVALGSCCCYHCSVEGGEEGVWFTALRASGQCVCDLMGFTVCTACFHFDFFLLAFIFTTSTTIYTIKLTIIMAY